MRNRILGGFALVALVVATPAAAQFGGRVSIEPYAAYGFFGDLPKTGLTLEGAPTFGLRAAYHVTPQWAGFVNWQRSTPAVTGETDDEELGEINVDHWSAGAEFAYIPRGGAEGMIPLFFEAGLGQVRYEDDQNSFAINLGIASGLQFTDRFAVRYGVSDYISNYDDNGMINQIFASLGVEVTF